MLDLKKIVIFASVLVSACQQSPQKSSPTVDSTLTPVPVKKPLIINSQSFSADDHYVLNLLLVAEIAIQRQQFDTALEAYLKASELINDARVAEKATHLGVYLEELGKTDKAVALWLKNDGKNMTARRIGLSVALKLQDQAALVKHLEAILTQTPASFELVLVEIQKSLKTDAEVEFVYNSLEELAQNHPKQAIIFLSQSLLSARQNKIELSRTKIAQALTLQPKWDKALEFQSELFIHSGKLAYKDKKLNQALEWFDKVSSSKHVFDASIASITVLGDLKEYKQAESRLKKILKTYPKQYNRIVIMQAELYNKQKQYQQAFAILTQALKKTPEDDALLYSRALTAEKLDDLPTLEQDLHKILAKKPKDVGALNALGYTLADKTQRYDEAEKYLKQALELQPEEAVIMDSYGWLLFKQGQHEKALEYLLKAHERISENEITAHLAEVLWVLNRQDEAKKLILEALEKTPDDEYLVDFKQRFLNNLSE